MKYFKRKCSEWRSYLDVSVVLPKARSLLKALKWGTGDWEDAVRSPGFMDPKFGYSNVRYRMFIAPKSLLRALQTSLSDLHGALNNLSHQQISSQVRANQQHCFLVSALVLSTCAFHSWSGVMVFYYCLLGSRILTCLKSLSIRKLWAASWRQSAHHWGSMLWTISPVSSMSIYEWDAIIYIK